MTNFLQLFSSLREQMNATLSRSDVLKPLAWLIGILVTTLIILTIAKAPIWMLATLAGFVALIILLYVGAYIYCLLCDRDSLRSETYTLNKMALQQGLYGDSRSGLIEIEADGGEGKAIVTATATLRKMERGQ